MKKTTETHYDLSYDELARALGIKDKITTVTFGTSSRILKLWVD